MVFASATWAASIAPTIVSVIVARISSAAGDLMKIESFLSLVVVCGAEEKGLYPRSCPTVSSKTRPHSTLLLRRERRTPAAG
jgi:hypothetical protein